jgi:hypothetical protein
LQQPLDYRSVGPAGGNGQTHWPSTSRWLLVVSAGFLVTVAYLIMCADTMPKSAVTPNAMIGTSVRVGIYYNANGCLPPNLSVLPDREGYSNTLLDAWNRPLVYTADSKSTFTLSSFGRDGVPGGAGDNADLVRKYQVIGGSAEPLP